MSILSFRREFSARQPRWFKKLLWFVGLPAWTVFAAAIVVSWGDGELPIWGWIGFAIFVLLVALQWYLYGRGELPDG